MPIHSKLNLSCAVKLPASGSADSTELPPSPSSSSSPPPSSPSKELFWSPNAKFDDDEPGTTTPPPPPLPAPVQESPLSNVITATDEENAIDDYDTHGDCKLSPIPAAQFSMTKPSCSENSKSDVTDVSTNVSETQPKSSSQFDHVDFVTPKESAPPPPPPIKKHRFRSVNKIDQDPETLPMYKLVCYNPPETPFQKEFREAKKKKLENRPDLVKQYGRLRRPNCLQSRRNVRLANQNSMKNASKEELSLDEFGNVVIKKTPLEPEEEKPVVEEAEATTYLSFRRRKSAPPKRWAPEETAMFYSALEMFGTDFTMIEELAFKDTGRDRKSLKRKFKAEERANPEYIDQLVFKSVLDRIKKKKLEKAEEKANAATQA